MTQEISKPHNNLFVRVMGSEEVAEEFLELNLPDDILSKVKLDTLSETGDSYVDDELRGLFSDVVYKIELEDGNEGYITFLLEHKSTPERKTILQLLKYMTRIWDKEYENSDNEDNDKDLPLVIPIVFYHGQPEWNEPVEFTGLMEGELDWAGYFTPDFGFYLYTLKELTEQMSEIETAKFRIYVKVLSLNRSRDKEEFMRRFSEVWRELGEYVRKTGEVAILTVSFRYILTTTERRLASSEEIKREAKQITPERGDDMETIADELEEKGRKEELIVTVNKLLEMRLEKLPSFLKEEINNSNREQLEKIRDNIFEIESVEDVEDLLE